MTKVFLIDMDGCVFNEKYLDELNKHFKGSSGSFVERPSFQEEASHMATVLPEYNQPLISYIQEQTGTDKQIIIASGSNRQDLFLDLYNSTKGDMYYTGSSFQALITLQDYLENKYGLPCVLNKTLMVDIYGGHDFGFCFNEGLEILATNKHLESYSMLSEVSRAMFDKTKITLIYFWAHYLAENAQDNSEPIEINFIDDREDILRYLANFLRDHAYLIPSNVVINFNHYAGGEVTPRIKAVGQGLFHSNYKERLREFLKAMEDETYTISSNVNIEETLITRKLVYFGVPTAPQPELLTIPPHIAATVAFIPKPPPGRRGKRARSF